MGKVLVGLIVFFLLSLAAAWGYTKYQQDDLPFHVGWLHPCDTQTTSKDKCDTSCRGDCEISYTSDNGIECYKCTELRTVSDDGFKSSDCDKGLMTKDECNWVCTGHYECTLKERQHEVDCYECKEPYKVECPDGTTPDEKACLQECPTEGTCVYENGCYNCLIIHCPKGTFKNTCPSSVCPQGCELAGEHGGVLCYRCKQNCVDTCAEHGMTTQTDYSNYILSELNKYECISGATVVLKSSDVGECVCSEPPEIEVDERVPLCTGSVCGDVRCGRSKECEPSEGQKAVVRCKWGGWEKVDTNQFRPVLGTGS